MFLRLALLGLCSCSFITASTGGSRTVTKTHEYVDAGLGTVASVGCIIAAVAWGSPDSFAPVADDPTSWESPSDRNFTIKMGKGFTPWTCTAAVAFFSSGIYGRVVRPPSYDSGGVDPAWGYAAAAFANGFLAAGQTQQSPPAVSPMTPVYRPVAPVYRPPGYRPVAPVYNTRSTVPPDCMNDFSCGIGYLCVKRQFQSAGVCMKSVDSAGAPTFEGPSTDSIGPRLPSPTDCQFTTDCSPGFRCDSGSCVR